MKKSHMLANAMFLSLSQAAALYDPGPMDGPNPRRRASHEPDESRIKPTKTPERHQPRFARNLAKGDMVTCTRGNGVPLTEGKQYEVIKLTGSRIGVFNDYGQCHNYPRDRFKMES